MPGYGVCVRAPLLRSLAIKREEIADIAICLFWVPAIALLSELAFDPHVTFLAGANASGSQR
jgi:predicted ATPase